MNAGIIGLGKYVPGNVVTNYDLEQTLDTNDEWIKTRTGIQERRIADETENTSVLALSAARAALKNSQLSADQIGLILVATVTPDRAFPSVACQLQEQLGAVNASAMDLSAACSGFIYGLATAKQFVESNSYKYILVVGAEKLSKITDWSDRNTAVLFGDGACAAVVGQVSDERGILAFELGADGTGGKHLFLNDQHTITMNGREVFKFAVRQMGDSALSVLEKAGLSKEDVNLLIPHQANIRIMEAAKERLELKDEQLSKHIHKYGNTSSASIGIALVDELESGNIHDDDVIVLVGFGGGLTWGSIVLKWGK